MTGCRNGVADDRRDLRHQPCDQAHEEAGRSLAVHHRFDAIPPSLLDDPFHGRGVVEDRRLVERPLRLRKIHASAPVLEPHVISRIDERIDQGALVGWPEDVRRHAGPVQHEDRTLHRLGDFPDVDEIQLKSVAGSEGNRPFLQACCCGDCHGPSRSPVKATPTSSSGRFPMSARKYGR